MKRLRGLSKPRKELPESAIATKLKPQVEYTIRGASPVALYESIIVLYGNAITALQAYNKQPDQVDPARRKLVYEAMDAIEAMDEAIESKNQGELRSSFNLLAKALREMDAVSGFQGG